MYRRDCIVSCFVKGNVSLQLLHFVRSKKSAYAGGDLHERIVLLPIQQIDLGPVEIEIRSSLHATDMKFWRAFNADIHVRKLMNLDIAFCHLSGPNDFRTQKWCDNWNTPYTFILSCSMTSSLKHIRRLQDFHEDYYHERSQSLRSMILRLALRVLPNECSYCAMFPNDYCATSPSQYRVFVT